MCICFKKISVISFVLLFTSTTLWAQYDDFAAPVDEEEPDEPSMSDPDYMTEKDERIGEGTTFDSVEGQIGFGATNFYSSGVSTNSTNYNTISAAVNLSTDSDYSYEIAFTAGQGSFLISENKFSTANLVGRWIMPLFMRPNEESPLYGGVDLDLNYLSASEFTPEQVYQGHSILGFGIFVGYEWQWSNLILDIEKSVSQTYGNVKASGDSSAFKDGISSNLKATLYFYNFGLGFVRNQMWQRVGDNASTIQSDFIKLGYRYMFN